MPLVRFAIHNSFKQSPMCPFVHVIYGTLFTTLPSLYTMYSWHFHNCQFKTEEHLTKHLLSFKVNFEPFQFPRSNMHLSRCRLAHFDFGSPVKALQENRDIPVAHQWVRHIPIYDDATHFTFLTSLCPKGSGWQLVVIKIGTSTSHRLCLLPKHASWEGWRKPSGTWRMM